MNVKEIIESKFSVMVHDIFVLGQGLDSIAYLVNHEYIFKQSKHDEARLNLKKEVQVLNYLKGKVTLQIPDIEYYSEEYGVCGYREIRGEKLTPTIYKNMSDDEKDKFEQGLKEVAIVFNSNDEFRKLLYDPRIDNEIKIEVIKEVFSEYAQGVFVNFLKLLIQEKRINLVNEIAEEYANKNRFSKNELAIKIIVAHQIQDEQITEIIEKYKKMYKVNSIKYEIVIDKEILGGIKVMVGNTVYDGSVKTKLKQMF